LHKQIFEVAQNDNLQKIIHGQSTRAGSGGIVPYDDVSGNDSAGIDYFL
jgi:hypothetical protein